MSKLKERTPIPHCCPVCGGNWEGDGFTTPIHCERIECPTDREPDADPLPCETVQLESRPDNGNPRAFIGIHEWCGGWNSVLFVWNPECGGFYEPYVWLNNTLGDGTRESAILEASEWAVSKGLPFWAPRK